MNGNLWQDWPIYILGGAVVFFFTFIVIKSNQNNKNKKNTKVSDKINE
ncbi:MAG: hypothetical protein WCY09_05005 [Candidatus Omnitrophota bacterium]